MTAHQTALPVAIIGAGPVGLAAAAHLAERGLPFVVIEAGPRAGHSVLSWGHVQLFSPWRYAVDRTAARLLDQTGWQEPAPEAYPTGRELVESYLAPLAAHPSIAPHLRFGRRVTAVSRAGFDKLKSVGRVQAPFVLQLTAADGGEELLEARAVIDASGTYTTPNPLGAGGLPALGERTLSDRITYGIPDLLGAQRQRYAGRRVLVAGSGHSAFNAVLDLALLAEQEPETRIIWAVRRGEMGTAYGGGDNDALPARGALGQRIKELVQRGVVELVTGWRSDRLERTPAGVVVSAGARSLPPVDELIVTTGLRPDLAMLSELRLGLDPAVEAPTALAPLIDPNLHSCGTVRPHGVDELSHPELDFYMIGMKSYGRAPTFLLLTGYEQARSVAAALAGDWEAARRVELELPETGVCSGPGGSDSACCAPAVPRALERVPLSLVSSTRLIALTPALVGVEAGVEAAGCCTVAEQETCCEPDAKSECCGVEPASASGCGCR